MSFAVFSEAVAVHGNLGATKNRQKKTNKKYEAITYSVSERMQILSSTDSWISKNLSRTSILEVEIRGV